MDRRKLVALRERFLSAQGTHPGRRLARMVPHDEADGGGAALQGEGRDFGRMRDGRHFAEYPGLSVLLQGCAGIEHVPRPQECRGKGCPDVFRLLERMVPGSVAAHRRRPAHGSQADGKSGIESACFFTAPPRLRGGAVNPLKAAVLPFSCHGTTQRNRACPLSTIRLMLTASCHEQAAFAASIGSRTSTIR